MFAFMLSEIRLRKFLTGEGRASDGVRTRDIQLGKLTLCQLSYARKINFYKEPATFTTIKIGLPLAFARGESASG